MDPKGLLEIQVKNAVNKITEQVTAADVDDVADMKKYVTKHFGRFRKWLDDPSAYKLKEKALHLELDKKLKIFEEPKGSK